MTDAWYEVQHFPHGITMIREPHQSEDVKSYLVEGERDVAIIDAASSSTRPSSGGRSARQST